MVTAEVKAPNILLFREIDSHLISFLFNNGLYLYMG